MEFCQSCTMPLSPEVLGTEKDGTPSADYCTYCYQQGEFVGDMTMKEMMEFTIEKMVEMNPDLPKEEVTEYMSKTFPTLKRWKEQA